MIEKQERLADDSGQETHGPVNAVSSSFKVPETSLLKGFKLWVYP